MPKIYLSRKKIEAITSFVHPCLAVIHMEEAMRNLQDALEGCLTVLEEKGQPIPSRTILKTLAFEFQF
ncbi:MAG: type II toxin-antitoxin system HicB family antitoxin [Candidatus Eremiobacteraeota bacterium]|nr:type II toxin-antitoxin system HicB family antitoxin [Candidatus Eremiobacteraeota bacterium]